MRVSVAWTLLSAVVVLACGGTTAGGGLAGQVTQEGVPVQGALVFLSASPSASTETDAEGRFLLDVPSGRHELTVRHQDADGALTERHLVAETDKVADLRLPRPTRLAEPVVVGAGMAEVTWNPYSGADFREYKLYRASSAALDESTGTLVHVGMASGTARFVDESVRPGEVYFYRVFVMNDFGRLAGSNIARLSLPVINLVQGGDFEGDVPGAAPSSFIASLDKQRWMVSDARAHSGTRALRGTGSYSVETAFNPGITQRIPGRLLTPGARYRLSFVYQRESFTRPDPTSNDGSLGNYIRLEARADPMSLYSSFSYVMDGVDTTWQLLTRTFTAPASGDAVVAVSVERGSGVGTVPDWVLWIDDVKLERVVE
ncbi:carboxypeptidase regulatory-like domain-containing protein [Myxococcus qinghaiensis]|uniref:carboxypeptidase regulatory-like domain-containing protein n=1 Tax=Myxococcus qinghaiensis TaxID=2906758 RepID=UPI0020A7EB53|nr:carboxypeptidase regulatory-like domain-containing protein [Myxococcus qinghaiensis]MCP3170134.1 hypothetical protein [Myxococcus qinghaiensis]